MRSIGMFLILAVLILANINYATATVSPSPYAMKDYSDSSGTVDLATGDMNLNLPVIDISGVDGGLSYPLYLDYSAGITVNQQPSQVGIGWGLNIPTITRTLRGVPDDYQGLMTNVEIYDKETGTYYNQILKEKKSWSSFWSSIGMTAVSLALTFAVPGGPAMTSEFITKTTAISAVPFLRGPPTYKEYETESKHFDIEAGTAATKGFFYLDEDVDDEYLLEVNNPDLFMVNSPVYSGGLTYSKYSPFDVESHSSLGGEICMIPTEAIGLNGDISSNPNLFNSENYCDNPLSFKFILENNEFNKIELVSLEGIKYTFEPTVIVTFSRVKQTKVPERDLVLNLDGACEKLYSQKRDYDYIEVNLTESYVSTWSLSRIESTRNSNDYIEFIYSNSVTRKTQSSPRCELLPDSRLSYSEIISDSKELIGIETPTYYADFNLGEEMETTGLMILPNGSASPKLKRLDSIDLIYKEDLIYDLSDELIESFKFNYAIKGETLNHPRGSLTLASVQECGMNLECFPKTKFEYSNNPVMFLDLTQESSNDFDRFGYYFNSPFEGKHAYGFGFDPNDATAWSLTKVSWSSGGSTEWDYISDSYNWIGNFSRFGWGGGIRVTKVQNCDGYDNCYNTYYSYSNGAINYLPGNYEGSLNDDTYSQGGSGVTMPKVIYDLVTVIKGNVSNYSFGEGNGKTVYNFTTAKDFPDKGPYIPPIFFETGLVDAEGAGNKYTLGFSTFKEASSITRLPVLDSFMVVAPAGDTLDFYLGVVKNVVYPYMDCIYTVQMPETSNCDFSGLNYEGSENLVCKTVKIDKCSFSPHRVFYYWNSLTEDDKWICGPNVECAFVISRTASNNDPVNNQKAGIYPFRYVSSSFEIEDFQYYVETANQNFNFNFDSSFRDYSNLACQDLNSNNVCDIEEFSEIHSYDFGGINFDKFRGLLLSKEIYNSKDKLISKNEYSYRGLDGEFSLNSPGTYFGYDVDGGEINQGQYRALSQGSKLDSFPYSMWLTLKNETTYLDGQEVSTEYYYGDNGLLIELKKENILLDGTSELLISEIEYVGGDLVSDCDAGDYVLRDDSAGNDYHVWNSISNSYVKKGDLDSDYLASTMNVYDINDKCYLSEEKIWRYDDIIYGTQGAPDEDVEYGHYVTKYFDQFGISSRGGTYDRASIIRDAMENPTISFYRGAGAIQCSGESGPRLTCVEDAEGNQIEYYYDDYGRIEEVKDKNDFSIYYEYDNLHRLYKITNSIDSGETKIEYNFGLDGNCVGGLSLTNENCMNWVKTIIKLDSDKSSIGISYADGLGRTKQTSQIKDSATSVVIDTTYNDLGLIKSVSNPYFFELAGVRKLISGIILNENELLSYHDDSEKSVDSGLGIVNFYYADPLVRIWKIFPTNSYQEGDENENCGEVVCTEFDYFGKEVAVPLIDSCSGMDENHVCITNEENPSQMLFESGDDSCRLALQRECMGLEVSCHNVGGDPPEWYNSGSDCSDVSFPSSCSYRAECGGETGELLWEDGIRNVRERDSEGNELLKRFDKFGNLLQITNAAGDISTFEYDLFGRILNEVDFKGRIINVGENKYNYNLLGQLIKKYDLNQEDHLGNLIPTEINYNLNGDINYLLDANGKEKLFYYDSLNRLYMTSISGVNVTKNYYDLNYNGNSCSLVEKSFGLLCGIENLITHSRIDYIYDGKGNIVSVIEIFGLNEFITNFEYDYFGNLVLVQLPNLEVIEYIYNPLNQLQNVSVNGIISDVVIDYTPEGLVDSILFPDYSFQDFNYNTRNFISNISVGNSFSESYSYDNLGNLKKIMDWTRNGAYANFNYDSLSRLEEINSGNYYLNGLGIGYEYDEMGNRLIRNVEGNDGSFPLGEMLGYSYGDDDKLDFTNLCSYDYDNLGALKTKICIPFEETSYDYDLNDRLIKIELFNGDEFKFGYDSLGRRIWKSSSSGGDSPIFTVYSYGISNNANIVIEPFLCTGDLNYDGIVNLNDATIFAEQYLGDVCDLNYDENCNGGDLEIFESYLGLETEICIGGISALGRLTLNVGECKNVCDLQNVHIARAGICNCSMPPKPDPFEEIHFQEAIDLNGPR